MTTEYQSMVGVGVNITKTLLSNSSPSFFSVISSHYGLSLSFVVGDTFLNMRQNQFRGLTPPLMLWKDDRFENDKGRRNLPPIFVVETDYNVIKAFEGSRWSKNHFLPFILTKRIIIFIFISSQVGLSSSTRGRYVLLHESISQLKGSDASGEGNDRHGTINVVNLETEVNSRSLIRHGMTKRSVLLLYHGVGVILLSKKAEYSLHIALSTLLCIRLRAYEGLTPSAWWNDRQRVLNVVSNNTNPVGETETFP